MDKHTIDASGKKIGRVASEAAALLMGKRSPAYRPHIAPKILVEIVNAAKLDVIARKMESIYHERYSGFHSGLKRINLARVAKDKGMKEVMRHAVFGMIRHNKLRKDIMKNLTITD